MSEFEPITPVNTVRSQSMRVGLTHTLEGPVRGSQSAYDPEYNFELDF